jgi:hypothetical protein
MSELVGTSWVQDYDAASRLGSHRSVLNVSGPLVSESMHCFGAKLTLALHYDSTGRIIPKTCSVGIRWYTNWDRMLDQVPQKIFELVGGPSTLEQGKQSVRNRFEYMHAAIPGRDAGLYVSAFGEAYLIVGFVLDSPENLLDIADPGQVFHPGCFRNSS